MDGSERGEGGWVYVKSSQVTFMPTMGSSDEKLTPLPPPWFPLCRRLPLGPEDFPGEGDVPLALGGVAGFEPLGGLELRRVCWLAAGSVGSTAASVAAACPLRVMRGEERERRSLSDEDDFIGALVGVLTRGDDRGRSDMVSARLGPEGSRSKSGECRAFADNRWFGGTEVGRGSPTFVHQSAASEGGG